MEKTKNCCSAPIKKANNPFVGFLYGVLPHSFCIAFILFSAIGAVAATSIFRKILLVPYFFQILFGLSLIFATFSALFYLKKNSSINLKGIKSHWKYLSILYASTILINLFFFFVVFPLTFNLKFDRQSAVSQEIQNSSTLVFSVQIPCSGHAPLVGDEIKKLPGINSVRFELPNRFIVGYNPSQITPEQIFSLEIFKTYPARKV